MQRVAIYARFSSDLQRDQSIDDQFHLCREHAKRQGWEIVEEYSDRARSGANLIGRPGVLRLLGDAAAGKFEIILAESPDRLSRDLADLATIRKTLAHQGVAIHSVNGSTGPLDVMEAGLRGIMGEMFLTDLKAKTRRGMLGVIREGRSAGGRQYGYRPVPGKAGQLEVVEHEAELVRRIWREYAAGKSPRAIVADLNAEGLVAPRGGEWRVNTVIGNKGRGGGILKNPLFEGRIVWGRVRMVVDPKTGRRLSRPNPEGEWQSADAPHLRIIDEDLVKKVRARQAAGAQDATIATGPDRAASCPGSCAAASAVARWHTTARPGAGRGSDAPGRPRAGPANPQRAFRWHGSKRRSLSACNSYSPIRTRCRRRSTYSMATSRRRSRKLVAIAAGSNAASPTRGER